MCCEKYTPAITIGPQLSTSIPAQFSAIDLESDNWLVSQAARERILKPCVKSSPPETAQA